MSLKYKTIASAIEPTTVVGWNTASAQDGANYMLEKNTVTAQRRAENLQDIPNSVNAFSQGDVETQRTYDFSDLNIRDSRI